MIGTLKQSLSISVEKATLIKEQTYARVTTNNKTELIMAHFICVMERLELI